RRAPSARCHTGDTNVATWHYLTLDLGLGLVPKKLCVGFYGDEDDDCIADQQAQHFEEATRIESAPFDDSVYGFNGMRTTAHLSYPPMLRSGSWFGSFQPASTDWGYSPISYGSCGSSEYLCGANYRDGGELNGCCDGLGAFGSEEWRCDCFYGLKISMRIEGIPAGDCVGTERVTAACKPGDGERLGKIVVKVRDGQPNGIVTALLDPPDPRSMSIALDGAGRGKGKFKGVALGEHRVFVCDSIVNVTCAP
ncbi:MAG: hypothetical protein L6Q93_14135, partial [Phycisphaerae bacterium]|nr:hypothetical protein [Phycisphaerae bacterium]